MALAADTRAAAVASFDRMMPTKTLSAVLVWLRASERISMSVFDLDIGHLRFARLRPDIFARRGVDMVHGQIVALRRRSKCNGRKIGLPAIVLRAANELNDFCAHENPSHTAMATSPTNASDIKYVVMFTSHDRFAGIARERAAPSLATRNGDLKYAADRRCDHFRREPYP
jgi:hypothetical protein